MEVLRRDDAKSCTLDQSSQIREHIRRGIRTEDERARGVVTGMLLTVRRGYRVRLGEVGLEDAVESRDPQYVADLGRQRSGEDAG